MFTGKGVKRTFKHNLSLAVLLSFTGGFVNVSGFFAIAVLTTNVTGHVANIAKLLLENDYNLALMVIMWTILFFLGSFVSSSLINFLNTNNDKYVNVAPIMLEALILAFVYYYGTFHPSSLHKVDVIAGSLMFAMGMQNSIVSVVSSSKVRTSHLTGMFTDLGIEISLLFYTVGEERKRIYQLIMLHSTIVIFFFLGGISGGSFYLHFGFKTFLIPVFLLIVGLVYDVALYSVELALKKLKIYYNMKFVKGLGRNKIKSMLPPEQQ